MLILTGLVCFALGMVFAWWVDKIDHPLKPQEDAFQQYLDELDKAEAEQTANTPLSTESYSSKTASSPLQSSGTDPVGTASSGTPVPLVSEQQPVKATKRASKKAASAEPKDS
jgi:cell division septation protein DedD